MTTCEGPSLTYVFVVSSIIVFVIGLILILTTRLIQRLRAKRQAAAWWTQLHPSPRRSTISKAFEKSYTVIKTRCEAIVSGSTVGGRIMVSVSCVLSIGSLVIYIIDASTLTELEKCGPWDDSVTQELDFALNVFFLLYFIVRFLAADNKLLFWLEVNSFVDIFTIPPVFAGIVLERQWLGFRFLRAIRVINIPDLLQYLSVLQTSVHIRLTQLLCFFFSIWLAAAGFIHLVENTGSVFSDEIPGQNLTYWNSVYFIVVTMSTVGYGDIYCHTLLGRAFIVIFLLGALAMFASFIPEIVDIFRQKERYCGAYDKASRLRHIVLCGHITYNSINNFVRDFIHNDRAANNIRCVFLHTISPDLELEALLKRHFMHISFFKGTAMNKHDLKRVKLFDAEACLILADHRSTDPDSEDSANILRVISIKNFFPTLRVIVQLLRYQNKAFCLNLPSWTTNDQVICLSQLKLGFMAAGCSAPGFSTLLANLVVMRSYKASSRYPSWQDAYMRGAGLEIYTEEFSPSFYGMPFSSVAEICFSRLNLLLFAVLITTADTKKTRVILNPSADVIVDAKVKGFFICQSQEEAKKAFQYCSICDQECTAKENRRSCSCKEEGCFAKIKDHISVIDYGNIGYDSEHTNPPLSHTATLQVVDNNMEDITVGEAYQLNGAGTGAATRTGAGTAGVVVRSERFESTGMFYWCPCRSFEQCILDVDCEIVNSLDEHIIVCCFTNSNTPLVGLRNLILPLRSSNLPCTDLKTVVLLGEEGFLRKEWPQLSNFPFVYIKLGSPLNRRDLRQVHINRCHMCLILAKNEILSDDLTLIDKESIICSFNIKTMRFGSESQTMHLRSDNEAMHFRSDNKTMHFRSECETVHIRSDKEPASIQRHGVDNVTFTEIRTDADYEYSLADDIPMLIELANERNVQFLDEDDEDDPDELLYLTQPFVCGRAFTAGVLNTVMSTIFFNPEVLDLIRTLIAGGDAQELEQQLSEGIDMEETAIPTSGLNLIRNRCRIALLPLSQRPLVLFSSGTYGKLVMSALHEHGILCLGLYRRLEQIPINKIMSHRRYVITSPSPDLQLNCSDKVYCLQPFSSMSQQQLSQQYKQQHPQQRHLQQHHQRHLQQQPQQQHHERQPRRNHDEDSTWL